MRPPLSQLVLHDEMADVASLMTRWTKFAFTVVAELVVQCVFSVLLAGLQVARLFRAVWPTVFNGVLLTVYIRQNRLVEVRFIIISILKGIEMVRFTRVGTHARDGSGELRVRPLAHDRYHRIKEHIDGQAVPRPDQCRATEYRQRIPNKSYNLWFVIASGGSSRRPFQCTRLVAEYSCECAWITASLRATGVRLSASLPRTAGQFVGQPA